MHSMQRQFGRLWSKGPGDNAKVSVLLKDYEDADSVLAKIIDSSKAWRNSWTLLVNSQFQLVAEYESLYDPIVGASDGHGRPAAATPELQLERTYKLKLVYGELRTELLEEITTIDERIIKPATDARDSIRPVRKTIKKRENKRLDYEKCQEKVKNLQRKPGKTTKGDAAMAKAEDEMGRAADEFALADDHIREALPSIITAAFSLIPPLLSANVLIQNRLLGLYYTTLHGYCEEIGFPSPPPPMEDVIAAWSTSFKPIQDRTESIKFVARGKSFHRRLDSTNNESGQQYIATPPKPRPHSSMIPDASSGLQQRALRIPSSGSMRRSPSPPSDISSQHSRQPSPGPKRAGYLTPTEFTAATMFGCGARDRTSPGASPNSLRPQSDYFGGTRRLSNASTVASNVPSGLNGGAAFKKKPPPPPPPKRVASSKQEEWVVALYTFAGEGHGDLSFQEGDRIRIVKKTNTDQDWWEGDLNGRRGSFPANYTRPM